MALTAPAAYREEHARNKVVRAVLRLNTLLINLNNSREQQIETLRLDAAVLEYAAETLRLDAAVLEYAAEIVRRPRANATAEEARITTAIEALRKALP